MRIHHVSAALVVSIALSAAACGSNDKPAEPPPTPTGVEPVATATATPEPTSSPSDSDKLIAPGEIAGVTLGTAEAEVEGTKSEDGRTIAITAGVEAEVVLGKVCAVWVDSGEYKTAEGLGVGSTRADFEKAYGAGEMQPATGELTVGSFGLSFEPSDDAPKPEAVVRSVHIGGCPE